jgi:ERCC4-type nuclease
MTQKTQLKNPDDKITVCPFTVVVDTREQAPYRFQGFKSDAKHKNRPLVIPTVRKALKTGDYSIEGFEDQVAVERKEFGDFYNCCGQDRERFQKQLERLNEIPVSAIVIEASFNAVITGHPQSKLNPKTVSPSVIAWQQRLPAIHWWFLWSRRLAEITTFGILERWWLDKENNNVNRN